MGQEGEECIDLLSDYTNSEHENDGSKSKTTKGGLITMPYILVNESFEKVASYGLLGNLIFYLMNMYHFEAANSSMILSLWSALSNFMVIFGAVISDSYLGRFRVIALGTLASLLGTALLWSTSMFPWLRPPPCTNTGLHCDSATPLQYIVLFSSFGLISIGAGCVRPCSIAFGADQFYNKDDPDNERVIDSFFNWYYSSAGLSAVMALTVVVYIQDQYGWQIGFAVPVGLMLLSVAAFLLGSSLYVHVQPPKESLFVSLVQVPLAAFRKRNIFVPPVVAEGRYFSENNSGTTFPSENLRCLNRACMIEEPATELLLEDGAAALKSRILCSVERVESVKAIFSLIPLSSTGIMLLIAMNNNYVILQANTMNRHLTSGFEIPAATFVIFQITTITFWIAFYDLAVVPFLKKSFNMQRGVPPKLRMGIGLALSCIALLVGGIVESMRRSIAITEGLENEPDAVVGMSALWLAPQLMLLGLAEAFNAVAQLEFFYTHLSKTMSSFAMALYTVEMSVSDVLGSVLVKLVHEVTSSGGNVSWLGTNLNKGHVDYYYWLLSFLSVLNLLYFVYLSR